MNISALQKSIGLWTCKTFGSDPDKVVVTLKHLESELRELNLSYLEGDKSAEEKELADLAILILGYAHRRGINLENAVKSKMAVNRKRKWNWSKKDGFFRHEKGAKK